MPACPHCGSRSVKRGFRKTRLGRKQLYLCAKCRRKSTPKQSAWLPRMRFTEKNVMTAVKLYKGGRSSSEVQKSMRERGVRVSRWTIIKWSRKFG